MKFAIPATDQMIQDFIRFVTADDKESTFSPAEFYSAHRYLLVHNQPKLAEKFTYLMPGQEAQGYP